MAYFHQGDNVRTNEFSASECEYNEVYLADLKPGEYIISDNPYYFQDQNGLMNGINETYRNFNLYNMKQQPILEMPLSWKTECRILNPAQTTYIRETAIQDSHGIELMLSSVLLFSILALITYRKRIK